MTAEERENLHDLYIKARDAWGKAERTGGWWREAYNADEAVMDYLYAVELAP